MKFFGKDLSFQLFFVGYGNLPEGLLFFFLCSLVLWRLCKGREFCLAPSFRTTYSDEELQVLDLKRLEKSLKDLKNSDHEEYFSCFSSPTGYL